MSSAGWYRGRGRSSGRWPGNGPFRDLPPWERPGWLYGPGSCWSLGYWPMLSRGTPIIPLGAPNELDILKRQKEILETQLKTIQETLAKISQRLDEIEK